jgi:hypothetical protein
MRLSHLFPLVLVDYLANLGCRLFDTQVLLLAGANLLPSVSITYILGKSPRGAANAPSTLVNRSYLDLHRRAGTLTYEGFIRLRCPAPLPVLGLPAPSVLIATFELQKKS